MKDDAYSGQMLAGKSISRLIGIDQRIRRRQGLPWQMVIGNQHLHAQRLGGQHAVVAGYAVIHGNQQIGPLLRGDGNNFRGQAVPVNEAVRHHIAHLRCAQRSQGPHR